MEKNTTTLKVRKEGNRLIAARLVHSGTPIEGTAYWPAGKKPVEGWQDKYLYKGRFSGQSSEQRRQEIHNEIQKCRQQLREQVQKMHKLQNNRKVYKIDSNTTILGGPLVRVVHTIFNHSTEKCWEKISAKRSTLVTQTI